MSNGGLGIYINRGRYLHVLGGAVVGGSEEVVGGGGRIVHVHGPLEGAQSLVQGGQACAGAWKPGPSG